MAGSVVPLAGRSRKSTRCQTRQNGRTLNEVSRACFYHLRAKRIIDQPSPPVTPHNCDCLYQLAACCTLTQCCMASSIVFNAFNLKIRLSRCVVDSKVHRSSNALLRQLHRLHFHHRIEFKLAKLAFLARSSGTSSYLNSSVTTFSTVPSGLLRSQDTRLLDVPISKS